MAPFCPACCQVETLGSAPACCGGYGQAADAEPGAAGQTSAGLVHAAITLAVLDDAPWMHAVPCCAGLAFGA